MTAELLSRLPLFYWSFVLVILVAEAGLLILNMRYMVAREAEIPLPPDFDPGDFSEASEEPEASEVSTPESNWSPAGLNRKERTSAYALARGRLGLIQLILNTVFLVLFFRFGLQDRLDRVVRFLLPETPYGQFFLYFFFLLNLKNFLFLPLRLYREFGIEKQFGFSKMSPGLFFLDGLKQNFLLLLLGLPLTYGIFLFLRLSGDWWWLYASGFFLGFQILTLWIYPVFLAPIFNRFTPLEEGDLRETLMNLARKASFPLQNIFVMDGSRRSAHSNAYFTGWGKGRRIVLFDTLLEQFTNARIAAVLAHEIGHYKKRHLIKQMLISVVFVVGAFRLIDLVLTTPALYPLFGFEDFSYQAAFLLSFLFLGVFSFFLNPLENLLSQKYEYEADRYSADLYGARPLREALYCLGQKNLSHASPWPLYSRIYHSHPPLKERMRRLEEEQRRERTLPGSENKNMIKRSWG